VADGVDHDHDDQAEADGATPTWPSALVSASTMIAPQPAKTSANVPIASASQAAEDRSAH
jgi:hypothetical protein